MGSTVVARQAGSQAAARATASRSGDGGGEGRRVVGANAEHHGREQAAQRNTGEGPGEGSDAGEGQGADGDHAEDEASGRPECEADSDLSAVRGDQVREDTVQSDGREQERQSGETAEDLALEALPGKRCGQDLIHGSGPRSCLGIHRADGRTHRAGEGRWRKCGADDQRASVQHLG